MSPVALLHLVSALVAMVAGAVVLLRRKGGKRHRVTGRIYFAAMLTLNVTALMIYRLFGGFGPFHVAALVSLATVVPGVMAARSRHPGWLDRHYYWMTFSYVGLLAAALSEVLTRLPRAPFWGAVIAGSATVFAVGAWLIFARARSAMAPFRSTRG